MSKKILLFVLLINLFLCYSSWCQLNGDSLIFKSYFNYGFDLSDTYGGGDIFSGKFAAIKSWYGIELSYGYFQSQSTFVFEVPLEESGRILEIPFDEMAIMKKASLSLVLVPIKSKLLDVEFNLGLVHSIAKHSCFKGVEYNYDLTENRFTYLSKDYQLVEKNHFGYQVGFNLSFNILKKTGIQINMNLEDLSNGGTFFLIGGGVFFKL